MLTAKPQLRLVCDGCRRQAIEGDAEATPDFLWYIAKEEGWSRAMHPERGMVHRCFYCS